MAERGQPGQYSRSGNETNESDFINNPTHPGSALSGNDRSVEQDSELVEKRGSANRGFAAMDRDKQRRIASEGGRAAHNQGVAHEWSKDEAREAGRKGGQTVSQNREHMSEIGRKGGKNSGQRRQRSEDAGQA